jgi:hypothetical protein
MKNLCAAIVGQAAKDYFYLQSGLKPNPPGSDVTIKECEEFFYSQYFESLCDLDPQDVIEALDKRAEKVVLKYIVKHDGDRYSVYPVDDSTPYPEATRVSKKKARKVAAELNELPLGLYGKLWKQERYKYD